LQVYGQLGVTKTQA